MEKLKWTKTTNGLTATGSINTYEVYKVWSLGWIWELEVNGAQIKTFCSGQRSLKELALGIENGEPFTTK